MKLPTLTWNKIMKAIENNPEIDCSTFMGSIEYNLWENSESLEKLSKFLNVNKDVLAVFTAIHNRIFKNIAIPIGKYNSYGYLE